MATCPLRCQEILVPEAIFSHRSRTIGNHYSEVIRKTKEGRNVSWEIRFVYHSTAICKAIPDERVFMTDNGGYKTTSTSCAIHGYQILLKGMGYREVSASEYLTILMSLGKGSVNND